MLSARFLQLATHDLLEASFARPRTGHDKGGVEARGKSIRWQELVPIPSGPDLGERLTAERVRRALETGEPLLLALRPSEPAPSMALEALPVRLREIDVASGRAADYDRLFGGAL